MINYADYIKKLKSRHPTLSPLQQLLQIDYLSCKSLEERLLLQPNFDQTNSSLLLYAVFLQYLEIPQCSDICFDKNFTVSSREIQDTINDLEKKFGNFKGNIPKKNLPLHVYISGYTVLCDLEPKGSTKVFWNGMVQTYIIRPKLRDRLKSLINKDSDQLISTNLSPF